MFSWRNKEDVLYKHPIETQIETYDISIWKWETTFVYAFHFQR